MLSVNGNKIYLYSQATDMRKSFNGLSVLVQAFFPAKLLTGSFFVFVNRRHNQVKVLYWDGDGLVVWHKRLERGTFKLAKSEHGELTRREFTMLLEGIEPRRLNQRYQLPDSNQKK